MYLKDFWLMERFYARYPPVDILVAAYVGYEAQGAKEEKKSVRQAARSNSAALRSTFHPRVDATFGDLLKPRGRGGKTLADMPAYLRTPEKMAMMAKMKAEMTGEPNAG